MIPESVISGFREIFDSIGNNIEKDLEGFKMSKPKYEIKPCHIEEKHGIAKLERDGFTKEQISKSMYKLTEGACQDTRTEIMSRLYDRSEK